MSIFKFDTIYPLFKSDNLSKETLTPRLSLRLNPANNMNMTHRLTFKFSDDLNVSQYVYTINK